MKRTIKRVMAVLLAMLMLILCACSPDEPISSEDSANNNRFTPTGQSVSSSIFGRNVKYDGWTPAEGLTLHVDLTEIADMIQIEKMLYLLTTDGVYTLNLETGESVRLTAPADFIATHGGTLYTYAKDKGALCVYSSASELISENVLAVESDELEIKDFFVTDDYYVFVCWDKSGDMYFTQYNAYSKETLELVVTLNEKKATYTPVREYCASKGNTLLKLEDNGRYDSRYAKIAEINLDKDKITDLADVNVVSIQSKFNISYNPKTDTAIVIVAPTDFSGKQYPLFISEHSLSDPDNIVHQRFYVNFTDNAKPFISIYENIVCVICAPNNEVLRFDYLNPPESITLACASASDYDDIISAFEKETGVLVRTVNYGNDTTRLDIKLMAGDTDFDLFCPVGYNVNKYVALGVFNELENYGTLTDKLDKSPTVATVAKYNGEYFAVPTYVGYTYPKALYSEGGTFAFSRIITLCQYCARNVDAVSQTYLDPDGEEFYKVLKFLYDNPEGNEKKMPFGEEFLDENGEFAGLRSDYVMLNPASENKDNAVLFMEFVYDAYSGNIDGIVPADSQYMTLMKSDVYFADWEHLPMSVVEPLFNAYHGVLKTNGSSKEIKALAKEAARQVKMRLEG